MDIARLCFRVGSVLLVLIYCNGTMSARMPPMQKMVLTDQEPDHDRVERSVAVSSDATIQAAKTVRAARNVEMPPTMQMLKAPTALETDRINRIKRDCGGCCGCGGGGGSSESGRRRRRGRRRERERERNRNRTQAVVHLSLSNSTYGSGLDLTNPQNTQQDQPVAPTPLIFVTNSSRVLPNGEEVESAEVIIISPDVASGDNASPSGSYSYEDSSESLIMPYVGTYGSRKVPPGEMCMSNADCVVGAVCKNVSGMGHCVCEPPLVNLGNGCVPRSGTGP